MKTILVAPRREAEEEETTQDGDNKRERDESNSENIVGSTFVTQDSYEILD